LNYNILKHNQLCRLVVYFHTFICTVFVPDKQASKTTPRPTLGIDIGTQSTRVALVDPDGHVRASYREGYPLHTPRHGWAEQDPEDWWRAICRGIAQVKARMPPRRYCWHRG
jgi:hypothetical protein